MMGMKKAREWDSADEEIAGASLRVETSEDLPY